MDNKRPASAPVDPKAAYPPGLDPDLHDAWDTLMNAKFRFWACPDHRGIVRWDGDVATCGECGRTSVTAPSPQGVRDDR